MKISFVYEKLKSFNPFFLSYILILQGIGWLSIYSTSFEKPFLFKQQLLWILISWIIFFIISYIKITFIVKTLWPLFLFHMICLSLIFILGKEVDSAKRWLNLGFFYYQPSETLKIILVLLTAHKISQRPLRKPFDFMNLLPFFFTLIPPLFLVFLQPDLGTAGITLIIIASLILFQGVERKTLFIFSALFITSTPLIWSFILKPYQKSRVLSFIKPGKDPQGTGYNVIQSKIAIGSGQIFGKGFKKGTQNKLQFLPERHTDFIFSVLSEEYGFLGSSFVLSVYFLMIVFIFNLARSTRDRLSCYFCLAIGSFLMWHVVLNISMVMGLFPVVGIPLPLLSYGGSNLITTMTFLGIATSIYKDKNLF
ncbi:MAG: rod shape-determining protein RodA [Bdellovibrionales bacterium]|nr:rod shape-determining protein RodA [Bdellovibrionales bacterium]